MELLLLIPLGFLGPLQGGAIKMEGLKLAARVGIGLCFAALLWQVNPWYSLYGIIVTFACMPGLGQMEGQCISLHKLGYAMTYKRYSAGGEHGDLERWQVGALGEWLRHRPYWGLVVRDMMFLNPAFMIASPVSMKIALKLPQIMHMDANRWHECLHYALAFALTWAILSGFLLHPPIPHELTDLTRIVVTSHLLPG